MYTTEELPTVELGGVNISRMNFKDTLAWIEGRLRIGVFTQIATANMDFLDLCGRHEHLKEILNNKCHLVTADGMPLVWLARAAGKPVQERVTGSDLLPKIAALAARMDLSVFFLGGDGAVTPAAVRVLREKLPNLKVAGMNVARFDECDKVQVSAIVEEIRLSKADILFVALGCPKQERFIAQNSERLGVRLAIGVGGSFDFIAGRRQRAPEWMQRAGLEWVNRMYQEPRRLAPRYLHNLFCFAQLAANRTAFRMFHF